MGEWRGWGGQGEPERAAMRAGQQRASFGRVNPLLTFAASLRVVPEGCFLARGPWRGRQCAHAGARGCAWGAPGRAGPAGCKAQGEQAVRAGGRRGGSGGMCARGWRGSGSVQGEAHWARGACWLDGARGTSSSARAGRLVRWRGGRGSLCVRAGVVVQNEVNWAREACCLGGARRGAAVRAAAAPVY